MSNNIFSWKRFQLLFRQHFIHNAQFLMLATGAYVGVIFIVLSLVQAANELKPHDLEEFQALMIALVTVFGILYVGHSFPAFRTKESTISYLMIPASALEKFVFEFLIRIVLVLLTLPLLYWLIFHLQGYFFTLFIDQVFEPIGVQYILKIDDNVPALIYALITGAVMFALSLAFTGSAMFTKQPLVKSLFAVATIVLFFVGYSILVIEYLGFGKYNPPEEMVLVPLDETNALTAVTLAFFAGTAVMLFVAYQKLKEREV